MHSLGRFGAKSASSCATIGSGHPGGPRGRAAAAAAARAKGSRKWWSGSWLLSLSAAAPRHPAAMDLAAAAEPVAGSQHLEVRDEVAEKCQKLFLDFLEE